MSGIHVLVINGPNLNLLGTREPQTYGYDTLSDVEEKCKRAAEAAGGKCSTFQSNYEGAIVERIHQAKADGVDGIVINAGESVWNLLCRSYGHREVYLDTNADSCLFFDSPWCVDLLIRTM
jgi:hypothetical protein